MKKPKVVTILGARPQFIKAAVVSPVLSQFTDERIIHTGQHFDTNMSDIFFEELSLPEPHYHLNIHGLSHGDMTGRMLIEIEKILQQEKPDLTLVYGDTNSTLAGALAASKLNIPIAHIEAGVRSFNHLMPEEINRIVTDSLSAIYFVTSSVAKENLIKEGKALDKIHIVGDVMCDLALKIAKELNKTQKSDNDYILVTLHRSENTDHYPRLKALKDLIEKLSEFKKIIWIMHPRTKKALDTFELRIHSHQNLILLEPQGYKEMMDLVYHSFAVATDSGGLQKEAYYYKKPCITLRNETEWVELNDCGWNWVMGDALQNSNVSDTFEEIVKFLSKDFKNLSTIPVYGAGDAAEKIGNILKEILV